MVGITINEYQVQRATYHNEKHGLSGQCKAVRGNFLDMPFEVQEGRGRGSRGRQATGHECNNTWPAGWSPLSSPHDGDCEQWL